jgi:hypothetical protein
MDVHAWGHALLSSSCRGREVEPEVVSRFEAEVQ